jgi:hypothetical protein
LWKERSNKKKMASRILARWQERQNQKDSRILVAEPLPQMRRSDSAEVIARFSNEGCQRLHNAVWMLAIEDLNHASQEIAADARRFLSTNESDFTLSALGIHEPEQFRKLLWQKLEKQPAMQLAVAA